MDIIDFQIAGYTWGIAPPFWKPRQLEPAERQFAALYFKGEESNYSLYLEAIASDDSEIMDAWIAFKKGVQDSGCIFIDDDNEDGVMLDVAAICRVTGLNRSYIKAEIKAGRLKGGKDGREHRIYADDYLAWIEGKQRK